MRTPAVVLLAIGLLAPGCVAIPSDALRPARSYSPRVERLSVSGFQRTEFRQTGGVFVQGAGGGFGGAQWGHYSDVTDAPTFRRLLENTGCARVVDDDASGSLRVEGQADGHYAHGWNTVVIILEAFTATPIFGMPLPGVAEGSAWARLYRDGHFAKEYGASRRLRYWTTMYSWGRDQPTAINYARVTALRQVADQVAGDLCGTGRVAEPGSRLPVGDGAPPGPPSPGAGLPPAFHELEKGPGVPVTPVESLPTTALWVQQEGLSENDCPEIAPSDVETVSAKIKATGEQKMGTECRWFAVRAKWGGMTYGLLCGEGEAGILLFEREADCWRSRAIRWGAAPTNGMDQRPDEGTVK